MIEPAASRTMAGAAALLQIRRNAAATFAGAAGNHFFRFFARMTIEPPRPNEAQFMLIAVLEVYSCGLNTSGQLMDVLCSRWHRALHG
jgi:hypothetical protein